MPPTKKNPPPSSRPSTVGVAFQSRTEIAVKLYPASDVTKGSLLAVVPAGMIEEADLLKFAGYANRYEAGLQVQAEVIKTIARNKEEKANRLT